MLKEEIHLRIDLSIPFLGFSLLNHVKEKANMRRSVTFNSLFGIFSVESAHPPPKGISTFGAFNSLFGIFSVESI